MTVGLNEFSLPNWVVHFFGSGKLIGPQRSHVHENMYNMHEVGQPLALKW
jgi:hypothetical protein